LSNALTNSLAPMVTGLLAHAPLSDLDRAAILSLPHSIRFFERGSYIVRDGDASDHCAVLLSGFAFSHKTTGEGLRQVVSVQIPGKIVDLQQFHFSFADYSVQTLTRCGVARVPKVALRKLASDRVAIADALIVSAMAEASTYREWIMNIGRRDARTRIAHFLCEFAARLDVQGIAPGQPYELPMTQEQIGDALGLTAVHVNRTLKRLVNDGLVAQNKRGITFPKWEALAAEADFNRRYLHLIEHPASSGNAR
jgi:CRP-like cAMP-binding protein